MGSDPASSVVNRYGQCWDVPNVFVTGAALFPQNSCYNPTGTIGALAASHASTLSDRQRALRLIATGPRWDE